MGMRREGVVGWLAKKRPPSVLRLEQGREGNRRRTSLLNVAFRVGGEGLEENPLPPYCVLSREGVLGGWLEEEPPPSVLHFEQGRDGRLVTEKNATSVLHLEQGRGLGAG
jgi:hypothetical protein